MAHLSAGRKVLNGSGQTVHKMSGRHGITGLLQYWLCVKMPAAGRVHRRIERKVCQQISGWPRSCSLRNAALDRITAPSRPVRLRNYLQRYELAPLHAVAGEAWMSLVCHERSFIRSSSMTASYIKLSLDFLTLQGNLACKEADLAGPV